MLLFIGKSDGKNTAVFVSFVEILLCAQVDKCGILGIISGFPMGHDTALRDTDSIENMEAGADGFLSS